MAASTEHRNGSAVNGFPRGQGLDMGVLARINALNEKPQEDDDAIEVVAEEASGLSHSPGDGERTTRRLAQHGSPQHEISRLEKEISEAWETSVRARAIAKAQGGGGSHCCSCAECKCSCHDRGHKRGDQNLPNPYHGSTLDEGSKGNPRYDAKAYDFWADVLASTKSEIVIAAVTPPIVISSLIILAWALGLLGGG